MSYTVRETQGTAPYEYTVISTYSHRELVNLRWVYSGLLKRCYDVPAVSAIASIPPVVHYDNQYGWNSSAISVAHRTGDVYTQFTLPADVTGVVCGLATERKSNDPRDIPHAFYVYQQAGRQYWRVTENGVGVTDPVEAAPDTDLFRIERRADTVSYFFNRKRIYVSTKPSVLPLRVVACMYAAGDGVN